MLPLTLSTFTLLPHPYSDATSDLVFCFKVPQFALRELPLSHRVWFGTGTHLDNKLEPSDVFYQDFGSLVEWNRKGEEEEEKEEGEGEVDGGEGKDKKREREREGEGGEEGEEKERKGRRRRRRRGGGGDK